MRFASTGLYGRNASAHDAEIPPTRFGPHQHELGPAGQRSPAQQQAEHQQRDGRAALRDDECGEQEQALVAAAHAQGRGTEPAHDTRMSAIAHGRSFPRLRRHCMEHQAPRRSPHYILRPVSVLPQVVVFFLAAALRGAAFLAAAFFVARAFFAGAPPFSMIASRRTASSS